MENIPNKVPLINQSSTPFGYQGGMSWGVSVEIKKKVPLRHRCVYSSWWNSFPFSKVVNQPPNYSS